MMNRSTDSVAVIVSTTRRAPLLARMLESLREAGPEISRIIAVDDSGGDPPTKKVVDEAPFPSLCIVPARNLGCGGGIRLAMQEGLKDDAITHFWILDDDAQAAPRALTELLAGMNSSGADLAIPLVLEKTGAIGWFPGVVERRAWRIIKQPGILPQEYIALAGNEPVPFNWAPWPSMLVSRRAVETCGLPRDDFWFQGEDLEFSLRLTRRFKGVLVPKSVCWHLPPVTTDKTGHAKAAYLKYCLMLQNTSYTFVRLPHGRRALRHLPGNFYRLFRDFGWSLSTLRDAWRAFCWGAIAGKTADAAGYRQFKQRLQAQWTRPAEVRADAAS